MWWCSNGNLIPDTRLVLMKSIKTSVIPTLVFITSKYFHFFEVESSFKGKTVANTDWPQGTDWFIDSHSLMAGCKIARGCCRYTFRIYRNASIKRNLTISGTRVKVICRFANLFMTFGGNRVMKWKGNHIELGIYVGFNLIWCSRSIWWL